MKWFFVKIILIYQRIMLILGKKDTCKFYPTCSEYSLQAFEKHGLFKGFYLTIKRIGKCHPWHPYEIDQIP